MDIALIGGTDGPTKIYLAGTIGDGFLLPALAVLILFYAIYFSKQFAQKKRGIQTRQLGKRKEGKVRTIEILLSAATLSIVPVQVLSIFFGWNGAPGGVRIAGCVIGLAGDLIFLIAVVTMRDSWRAGIPAEDKTDLIEEGIYRYSRNPAFLGFDLMYIGILLMYFNAVLLLFTVWAVIMLHLQILQEEEFLCRVFGARYEEYRKHTARYLGRKR